MHSFANLAAAGSFGVVLLKLFATILSPLLGHHGWATRYKGKARDDCHGNGLRVLDDPEEEG